MRILIIGAGHAGFQIAKRLYEEKHSIVLVDSDADVLALFWLILMLMY